MNTGDTLHCWVTSDDYIAHKDIVYLGMDSSKCEKILVAHKDKGWDLIEISALPKDGFRKIGSSNLVKESAEGEDYKVEYQYWNSNDKFNLVIEIKDGLWILNYPETKPSWVKN